MVQIDAADLMLATLAKRPFSEKGWLYELKYDGYRCLVRKAASGNVDLVSRAGNRLNSSFPDVVEAVAAMHGDFVVDAELTVDDAAGRSSFDRLRKRAATKTPRNVRAAMIEHPARLYLFDALSIGSGDLRALALEERKEHLRGLFDDTRTLIYASGVPMAGEWVFEQVKSLCFEGMVAKRLSSPYSRGRSLHWLKIKNPDYDRPAALGFGHTKKSPA
jgi:bifunctional non-homologous end joining protein LigD